jgi:hypothetical protein
MEPIFVNADSTANQTSLDSSIDDSNRFTTSYPFFSFSFLLFYKELYLQCHYRRFSLVWFGCISIATQLVCKVE